MPLVWRKKTSNSESNRGPQLQSDDDVLVIDALASSSSATAVHESLMSSNRRNVARSRTFMPFSEADSSSRRNSASASNEIRRGDAVMDSEVVRDENLRVVIVDSDVDSSSRSRSTQMSRASEPVGYPNAEAGVRNPNSGMLCIPDISDDDCFKGFRRIEFGCETEFLLPESDGANLNKSNEIEFFDDDDAQKRENKVRLQKLKDELVCSVCLDLCYEPCTISCSHTFCKSCLINSVRACGSRCPKCRAQFKFGSQGPLVNTMIWNSIQLMFPDDCVDRKRAIDEEKALEEQQQRNVSRRIDDGDGSDQWHHHFTAFHEPGWAQEFFEADNMVSELDFRSSIGLGQRRSHGDPSRAARSGAYELDFRSSIGLGQRRSHGGSSRAARSGSSDRPRFQSSFIPATNATGIVLTTVSRRRSAAVANASPELFYREEPLPPAALRVPSTSISTRPPQRRTARMNARGSFNFAEEAENARRRTANWSRRQRARL